ncbi:MAG: hypothetical protein R3A12_05970 [Ignavibacteria bacterium]
MEDSRNVVLDNGIHYIFWGIVVTAALIANYIMLLTRTSMNYVGMMWFVLMTSAAIADAIIGNRQVKRSKVRTYAGDLLSSLWKATGIAMFMFGFLGIVTRAYDPIYISPVISTTLGIAYFTSGAIQQLKWLKYVSIGWWAGAVYLFIFPSVHTLLIFAIMMICLQIIPGLVLNRKYKENTNI